MFELFYTSVPRGLVPGTSGYTTVGCTSDMGRTLIEQAERLSTYSSLSGDPTAYAREPINWAHLQSGSGSKFVHIVSRIAACAPDHTGRSNYLAHHAFLSPHEAAATKAGPAALVADPGFLSTQWQGEARYLPARGVPAVIDRGPTTAAIEAAGLDPGWGASLADRLVNQGIKQTFLIYSPGTDIIGIVRDVLSELSPEERWQATFATHATKVFPGLGVSCKLQCVVAGTPYAAEVLARSRSDAFDLTTRPLPPPRLQRPKAITAAAPRPIAAKPTRALPTAPVQPTRTDPFVTMAEPEYENFSPTTTPRVLISQPPVMAGDSNVFNSPVTLLLAGLSALMTIGCLLLGSLWLQSGSKLNENELKTQNTKLTDKLDKLEIEADRLRSEVAALKAKPAQPQKAGTPAQQTAANEASQQPREATETLKTSPTTTQRKDKPQPNAAAPQLADTPVKKPANDESKEGDAADVAASRSAPDTSSRDDRESTTAVVSNTVQQELQAAITNENEKRPPITLITQLAAAPKNILLEETGARLFLSGTTSLRSKQWDIIVANKKPLAKVSYNRQEQTLTMTLTAAMPSHLLHCLLFLSLEVHTNDNHKLRIAFGSPLDAKLTLRERVAGSNAFTIFDNDQALTIAPQLHALFNEPFFKEKKLCESIQLGDERELMAYTATSKDLPGFIKKPLLPGTLLLFRQKENVSAGIELKRIDNFMTYSRDDTNFYCNFSEVTGRNDFNSVDKAIRENLEALEWRRTKADLAIPPACLQLLRGVLEKIPKDERADNVSDDQRKKIDASNAELQKQRNAIQALIEAAGTALTDSNYNATQLIKALRDNPVRVRYVLKETDSEGGLVIVDSLNANDTKQ